MLLRLQMRHEIVNASEAFVAELASEVIIAT